MVLYRGLLRWKSGKLDYGLCNFILLFGDTISVILFLNLFLISVAQTLREDVYRAGGLLAIDQQFGRQPDPQTGLLLERIWRESWIMQGY